MTPLKLTGIRTLSPSYINTQKIGRQNKMMKTYRTEQLRRIYGANK